MPEKKTSSGVPPAIPTAVREAVAKLRELGKWRAELSGLARFYVDLLPLLFGGSPPVTAELVVSEDSHESVSAGVPLFRVVPPRLDVEFLKDRWLKACDVLAQYRDPEEPRKLAEAVVQGAFSPAIALGQVLESGPKAFQMHLEHLGRDVGLGTNLLWLCALPHLASLLHSCDVDWQRLGWSDGSCPACGSWPIVAEIRGLEQMRWLRCGLCGSGWQVDRLFCPFCKTRDHEQLQDLFVEGEEQRYRVAACDACRGFVRTLSVLTPCTAPGLLVAELETMHLGLLAEERGYSPPLS